jgi:hypothetical protein
MRFDERVRNLTLNGGFLLRRILMDFFSSSIVEEVFQNLYEQKGGTSCLLLSDEPPGPSRVGLPPITSDSRALPYHSIPP